MSYKHSYHVLIGDDYTSEWVKVWAWNKEDVYEVCAKRYPNKYVEEIRYIK